MPQELRDDDILLGKPAEQRSANPRSSLGACSPRPGTTSR